jgi:glycosyltransferase involved in cell wall biosynthesis
VLDLDEEEVEARLRRLSLVEGRGFIDRLSTKLDLQRLHNLEKDICKRFTLVTLSSALELTKINLPQACLLPNCPPAQAELINRSQTTKADHLLFIGTLEYDPNLHGLRWFLRHVWPRLRSSCPNAALDIIGEGSNACPDIQSISGVQVHGYVPDPQAFWERSALAIVPVFAGGGTRIKILDAWQRGVPVVSTSIGVEGLDALPGVHLLVADGPDEFAYACERLLGSPRLGKQITQRASALIETCYSRKRIKRLVSEIAQSALQAGPSR